MHLEAPHILPSWNVLLSIVPIVGGVPRTQRETKVFETIWTEYLTEARDKRLKLAEWNTWAHLLSYENYLTAEQSLTERLEPTKYFTPKDKEIQ